MANTAQEKPTLEQAQAVLKYMDTDKNGHVSQAEFVKGMRLLYKDLSEAGLKATFKELDKNNDGTMSPAEFLKRL